MTYFGRVLTAMITPFDQAGAVDYESAQRLASHLVSHGTDTIVVCGTTGESPTLTWEEEYKLFQVIKAAIQGHGKIIAGTGSNSTTEAIEATKKAAELELDGTLQVVPYYNKPPQAGLQKHFSAIANAVPDLPVMLYNIPGRTGQNLAASTIANLAKVPNVVAVKEASGDLDQVSEIRRLTASDFDIYSGDDSLTLPMLSVGATGVVSVASHLVGESLQQMIQAYEQGQVVAARDMHLKLLPLFKALFATTNPILIKAAMHLQGWSVGTCRLPLGEAPAELSNELKGLMAELDLLPVAAA
ncbi:4-hydroxy-tetrahydrodipicolinate synthase [Leptolyngbyaceae cyanobacterium CCMR0082]|uniref:4-hydroxy-tetrahydrodipicolinate synthase n=2 Tax=Adonisia turfae TaxID=2950184 RepID=A0A6M0S300_9CYAN|nr:4-hydroxy-tetrahydrodipicolinate synthase [Leptothoe sp. LEGE 181152]NEZ54893.1 4-hydroxy-tetrahydrodipicolinate synthase [Adonisia turfae CCMR0081]NEZ62837.1 4-hydroxy-tetrahydrodipicolinate synthase [Adonisia turfae CCMR0082]